MRQAVAAVVLALGLSGCASTRVAKGDRWLEETHAQLDQLVGSSSDTLVATLGMPSQTFRAGDEVVYRYVSPTWWRTDTGWREGTIIDVWVKRGFVSSWKANAGW